PSHEANTSHPTTSSILLPSIPTSRIPNVTQTDTTPIRQYLRRARIAQSSALPTAADEPASLVRDVSKGEACPTESGFIADQDKATIAKSSTLPYDSAPRDRATIAKSSTLPYDTVPWVTSLLLLRAMMPPIKGRRIDEEEGITGRVSSDTEEIRMDEGEVVIERTSKDTEDMATVLTSMDVATVLAGGIDVSTGSYSIPTAGPPAV
nr:hypothetical protein [Tanacetum cinerariifolium]